MLSSLGIYVMRYNPKQWWNLWMVQSLGGYKHKLIHCLLERGQGGQVTFVSFPLCQLDSGYHTFWERQENMYIL